MPIRFRGIAGTIATLIVVFLIVAFWDWLEANEPGSATLRNLALTAVAAIGLPLAIWRSLIAERQARSTQSQADTAQRGFLHERYQKGAEMLGGDILAVRLGGIYALQQLAFEHPKNYHIKIMQLFCAFVRHPPAEGMGDDDGGDQPARADIYAVMRAIGARTQDRIALEQREGYRPDLTGADLRKVFLYDLNLSGILFSSANLSGASLCKVNLSKTHFLGHANLSGTDLSGSDLSGALLSGADLSKIVMSVGANFSKAKLIAVNLTRANLCGADFEKADFTGANLAGAVFHRDGFFAEGLTQQQINCALASPENQPPTIDGLIDAETGEEILWSKRPQVV